MKNLRRRFAGSGAFFISVLTIEFLDELAFGVQEAAWPLIRADLGLSYVQIGLLLALPRLFSAIIEPILGILGDTGSRRALIVGGGSLFFAAMLAVAATRGFWALLTALLLLAPASGAFVNLAQASLMDADPARRQQNMARWTFVGSLGVVIGPLLLSLSVAMGSSWRLPFIGLAVLTLLILLGVRKQPFAVIGTEGPGSHTVQTFIERARGAVAALGEREVFRWLALLEFSDLMLDVLHGYLALYFVEVVGVGPVQAGLIVSVWTGFGLLGDLTIIPVLERINGLRYLRLSALVVVFLFPAFLLFPSLAAKIAFVALLGFSRAGWYPILQAQLYQAMPGKSGRVMTVGNLAGLAGSVIPFLIGALAQRYNLDMALWVLLMGPLALMLGVPRRLSG